MFRIKSIESDEETEKLLLQLKSGGVYIKFFFLKCTLIISLKLYHLVAPNVMCGAFCMYIGKYMLQ